MLRFVLLPSESTAKENNRFRSVPNVPQEEELIRIQKADNEVVGKSDVSNLFKSTREQARFDDYPNSCRMEQSLVCSRISVSAAKSWQAVLPYPDQRVSC